MSFRLHFFESLNYRSQLFRNLAQICAQIETNYSVAKKLMWPMRLSAFIFLGVQTCNSQLEAFLKKKILLTKKS